MNDEKNIQDVENFEEVNENREIEVREEVIIDEYTNDYKNNGNEELLDEKKNKGNKNGMSKTIALALIVGILGGTVGGGATYFAMKNNNVQNNITPNPATFAEGENVALTATEAFEKVAPAVVIVSAKGTVNYGGFIPKEVEGIGSGFIINEEGYILTNYHVVEGAQEVTVTLSSKEEVKAKIINYDQAQDIAMLKITDETVKVPAVVELGDSDALKPGEEVIAIGTPLSKDFSQTLTGGLVSGINRNVETSNGVTLNLIQTDTAINPGNSGGPLVNTKGEVIGINTLKMSGEAEGIGFAIPINEVKGRIESLSKPILNLGVSIREVDEELAKQYDMSEGLYVVEVSPFSPAEKSGIKGGDIITKADGKRIKTFDELKEIKNQKQEGDLIKLEIERNKEKINVDLILEAEQ